MITGLSDILPSVASAFNRLFAKVAGLSGTEHKIKPPLPPPPAPPSLEEMEHVFEKTILKDPTQAPSYICYLGTKGMASYIEEAPYRAWSRSEENGRYAASHAIQQILGDTSITSDEQNTRIPNVRYLLGSYALREHILRAADDFRSAQTSSSGLVLVNSDFNDHVKVSGRIKAAILTEFVERLSSLVEGKYPDLLPEEKPPLNAPPAQSKAKVIYLN